MICITRSREVRAARKAFPEVVEMVFGDDFAIDVGRK